ncbi:unnamed protein product [Thelazia callipaeda]|uniref:Ovule protein n=1 Tax=Thelazia callipaeda TaxID=103827 RepID=A0A0N5D0X2_THECL|nr:unnamed protein product [Thelazia callipaeda]
MVDGSTVFPSLSFIHDDIQKSFQMPQQFMLETESQISAQDPVFLDEGCLGGWTQLESDDSVTFHGNFFF